MDYKHIFTCYRTHEKREEGNEEGGKVRKSGARRPVPLTEISSLDRRSCRHQVIAELHVLEKSADLELVLVDDRFNLIYRTFVCCDLLQTSAEEQLLDVNEHRTL